MVPALWVLGCIYLTTIFLFPLYNSGDDFLFMYMLSGARDGIPTNLLHLDYCWHPSIGWVVKSLFIWIPGWNWYSIFLLSLIFLSNYVILKFLIKRFGKWLGYSSWIILFIFSGVQSILSLNYTSTAWILATAGMLMVFQNTGWKKTWFSSILGWFLLVIAGLLRIHALAAVVILFIPVLIQFSLSNWRSWASQLFVIGIIMFLLGWQQKSFYRARIERWDESQAVRMSLVHIYNRPVDRSLSWRYVYKDSTEALRFVNQDYFSKELITPSRIDSIGKRMTRVRDFTRIEDWNMLYWFFMGIKVYLLLLFVIIVIFLKIGLFKPVARKFKLPFFFIIATYIYLFVFLKLTLAVFLGLINLTLLFLFLSIDPGLYSRVVMKSHLLQVILLLSIPVTLHFRRINQDNNKNLIHYLQFRCEVNDIQLHPECLFISIDNSFSVDYFHIWDSPSSVSLRNWVNKGKSQLYYDSSLKQRFGLRGNNTDLYDQPNVRIIGSQTQYLSLFIKKNHGKVLKFNIEADNYKCLRVWKADINEKSPNEKK